MGSKIQVNENMQYTGQLPKFQVYRLRTDYFEINRCSKLSVSLVLYMFEHCFVAATIFLSYYFRLRAGLLWDRSSSPGRVKIFLLSTTSKPILGPTQPPI
jgi:hypothetical protein